MASTLKHLRSSTANKRPTASGLADGQIAINTASGTPGMFFKGSNGEVVKVGPTHVGGTAPNATPAGSAGNSTGELWVNNSTTIHELNYYNGSSFVNLTPSGTETTAGLVELATAAETQAGVDAIRAVTPSGLQSKISDSTSTTSSTTIASATAVKAAYDLANAALPTSGGRVTGNLEIGPAGSLSFEGSSDDGFETTLAVVNPTADRTITFPNITGTVVTTGDTGTVTSTMIADGTIVNADINASAAIALSKLATGALPSGITVNSSNIVDGSIVNADINASAAIALSKLATGALPSGITIASANIVDGTIVNADVNASAAIAGTKISPNFGSQNVVTTGTSTAASLIPTGSAVPTNGVYLPSVNTVGVATNSVERVKYGTSEVVFNDAGNNYDFRIEGDTNANLLFVDASADAIGIGTSSPSELLHIDTTTNNNAILLNSPSNRYNSIGFQSGGTNKWWMGRADSDQIAGDPFFIGRDLGNVTDKGGNSASLVIDSSGRVGIGTTSPSETLEVAGNAILDASNANLKIKAGGAGTTGAVNFTFNTDSTVYGGLDLNYDNRATDGVRLFAAASNYPVTIESHSGAYIAFRGSTTERARTDSSGRLLVGTSSNSGGALLQVNDNRIRIATAKTPSSAADTGTAGEICWDADYIYVCTATNTWKRTAIATW